MIDFDKLKAPFPPDKVSWRVGSTNGDKSKGMALAYIDARDVMERLDIVCGPGGWQDKYEVHGTKTICYLSVYAPYHTAPAITMAGPTTFENWITKADGAGDSDVEAEKGAISDAFKRAAVKWGIGRYLYDIESPWVEIEPAGRSFRIKRTEYAKLERLLAGAPAAPAKQAKPAVPTTPLPDGIEAKPAGSKLLTKALILAVEKSKTADDLRLWWASEETQANFKKISAADLARVKEAKAVRWAELTDGVPA